MTTMHQVLLIGFGVLTAVILLGAGGSMVAGVPKMREAAEHFSIPWGLYRILGASELVLAIGVIAGIWLNALGLISGIVVLLVMLAAIGFHIRFGDPAKEAIPAIATLVISGVYVAAQAGAVWG